MHRGKPPPIPLSQYEQTSSSENDKTFISHHPIRHQITNIFPAIVKNSIIMPQPRKHSLGDVCDPTVTNNNNNNVNQNRTSSSVQRAPVPAPRRRPPVGSEDSNPSPIPCRTISQEDILKSYENEPPNHPRRTATSSTTASATSVSTESLTYALEEQMIPVSSKTNEMDHSQASTTAQFSSLLASRHGTLRRSDMIRSTSHQASGSIFREDLFQAPSGEMPTHQPTATSGRSSTKIHQLIQSLQHNNSFRGQNAQEDPTLLKSELNKTATVQPQPQGVEMQLIRGPSLERLASPPPPQPNFHSALTAWGEQCPKVDYLTFLPLKSSQTLNYRKLMKRALSVAYVLRYKLSSVLPPCTGHAPPRALQPGERVGICIDTLDPVTFAVALYGCLLARFTPVPVEVPLAGMDHFTRLIGAHLKTCQVRLVLTNSQFLRAQTRRTSQQQQSSHENAALSAENVNCGGYYLGWPRGLHWVAVDEKRVCSRFAKIPKDFWNEVKEISQAPENNSPVLIEYSTNRENVPVAHGAVIPQSSLLSHCRLLASTCHLQQGDVCLCLVEHRRELGLWHALLTTALCGAQSILISRYRARKNPNLWLRLASQHEAKMVLVNSGDLQAVVDSLPLNELQTLRLHKLRHILVCDAADPWSVYAMDAFQRMMGRAGPEIGFHKDCVRGTSYCSETLTLSLQYGVNSNSMEERMVTEDANIATVNSTTTGGSGIDTPESRLRVTSRGHVRLSALHHNVVQLHSPSTAATGAPTGDAAVPLVFIQDCGMCLPSATLAIISPDGVPRLCQTDQVGEIVLRAPYCSVAYCENAPATLATFLVKPIQAHNEQPMKDCFVRSGFLGFVGASSAGPVLFIVGTVRHRLMTNVGILNSVEMAHRIMNLEGTNNCPIYRHRCVLISVPLLGVNHVVLLAELRNNVQQSDPAPRLWAERVLRLVQDTYHLTLLAILMVSEHQLPQIPFAGIDVHECRRLFLIGHLHPRFVWLSPRMCCNDLLPPEGNLLSPEVLLERRRNSRKDSTHSSSGNNMEALQRLGQLVTASRPAEICGPSLEENVSGQKDDQDKNVLDILMWRAAYTPEEKLFCLSNGKTQEVAALSCTQLLKKADKIAAYLMEKMKLVQQSVVLIIMPAGIEMLCGLYGVMLAGGIPLLHKAPNALNVMDALPTCLTILRTSSAVAVLCTASVVKLFKTKEAQSILAWKRWSCPVLTLEDVLSANCKRRFSRRGSVFSSSMGVTPGSEGGPGAATVVHLARVAYLDYLVTNDGALSQVAMSHRAVSALCQAVKVQCELYPTREVALCLDPFSGLGLLLWCLSPIYCGHRATLVPLDELDTSPYLWLSVCSQRKIRDVYCTYPAVNLVVKMLSSDGTDMKSLRGVSLDSVRALVVIGEERPRVHLLRHVSQCLSQLGLRPNTVVCSFGTRGNPCVTLQSVNSLERHELILDRVALRHNRARFLDLPMEESLRKGIVVLEPGGVMSGTRVAILEPGTWSQLSEGHIGEVCVASEFNTSPHRPPLGGGAFEAMLWPALSTDSTSQPVLPEPWSHFQPTGFLGFVKRMERVVGMENEYHDALFILGPVTDLLFIRGLYYFPYDLEITVINAHEKILDCAIFMTGGSGSSGELVVCVEVDSTREEECASVVFPVVVRLLEEHAVVANLLLVLPPASIPLNSRSEKQRWILRDLFLQEQLLPTYATRNN